MKQRHIGELITSFLLIGLVVFILNPMNWWMPSMMFEAAVILLVIIFSVFACLVWIEKARDEREVLHKMHAGRIGFLTGLTTLVLGIVIQAGTHNIDPWLVIAVSAMLIGKIIGHLYSQNRN